MRKKALAVVAVLGLAAALGSPAWASRTTYDRRFVNRTSVPISVYLADEDLGVWGYQFTVYPGIPVVQRGIERRGLESRRLLFGADVGSDGAAIDLMRNDFGTVDWAWRIGESVPR